MFRHVLTRLMQSLGTDHATSTALYSVFLDLLSSPPELEYFKVIHDEAAAVFRREEDWVNSASLHKLTHSDSALRESLRQNPIFGRGAMQEVMPSHGVTLPDGHHVPRGTWLGVSMADIHMDERYYPDPRTYDPFRFSRARAELVSRGEVPSSISSEAVGDRPNGAYLSMTDEAFASFGFGRHAWYVDFFLNPPPGACHRVTFFFVHFALLIHNRANSIYPLLTHFRLVRVVGLHLT